MLETNKQIVRCGSIVIALFLVLALFALHNTLKYLVKEQRYRNLHLSYFYTLVYLICFCRIAWLSLIIKVVRESGSDLDDQRQST